MLIALLTAIGVGMSTIVGSLASFFVKKVSHKVSDSIMSFAAGIMLAATFFSLILPALENKADTWLVIAGIICGAVLIRLIDRVVPHIHNLISPASKADEAGELHKVILFLIAIAIHNFPEGLAVGVSFGTENIANAFSIAIGISLQNIPEGMITILPLILAGVSRKKAFLIALATGVSEIIGVILGYFTVSISEAMLPFILALAGGTMLYVISHDMIPETHSHGYENTATFSLIFGFVIMIIIWSVF